MMTREAYRVCGGQRLNDALEADGPRRESPRRVARGFRRRMGRGVLGAWLIGLLIPSLESRAANYEHYFGLSGPGESRILLATDDGRILWTNTAGTGVVRVLKNTSQVMGSWREYARQPITGHEMAMRVMDFETPAGMAYIPAGWVRLGMIEGSTEEAGDAFNGGTNWIRACYMDRCEVTKALWDAVRAWGLENGFVDLPVGAPGGQIGEGGELVTAYAGDGTHPVTLVNWFDAVKWCNARSLMEGLPGAYYTDDTWTEVYKTGALHLASACVDWDAAGYRLPTEAEWEKGARGGVFNHYFPWESPLTADDIYTNLIDISQANFVGHRSMPKIGLGHSTPAGYYNGQQEPAGADMANNYGLYDMAGTVWELCWDWYCYGYYQESPVTDPRGPDIPCEAYGFWGVRAIRGGSFQAVSRYLLCSYRDKHRPPEHADYALGFRCVRAAPE